MDAAEEEGEEINLQLLFDQRLWRRHNFVLSCQLENLARDCSNKNGERTKERENERDGGLGPLTFEKMGQPGLFLFIFVLFKHKFYRKPLGFNMIQTRIVG